MDSDADLISIVVPVYNVKDYLFNCLWSLSLQTYHNIEIILVDDGSTDGSGAICDEWCLKDKRFKVVHEQNAGQGEARNAGLRLCKGDYITFVDGDDYIHNTELSVLHDLIKGNDIAMTGVKKTSSEENICAPIPIEEVKEITARDILHDMIMGDAEIMMLAANITNKLYSKHIIKGLFFKDCMPLEDQDFNVRVFQRIKSISFCDTPLYYYRWRVDSTTNDVTSFLRRAYNYFIQFNKFLDYFPEQDSEVRGWLLDALYMKMLARRFVFQGSEYEASSREVFREILSATLMEFRKNKFISSKSKMYFYLLWPQPWLVKWIMRIKGN